MLEDSCQASFCLKKVVHVVGKNWIKLASVADQCFQSLVSKDVTQGKSGAHMHLQVHFCQLCRTLSLFDFI